MLSAIVSVEMKNVPSDVSMVTTHVCLARVKRALQSLSLVRA